MEFPKPTHKDPETGAEYEVLTFEEYKDRIGCPQTTNPALTYQMAQGNLDWVVIGRFRHIIFNEKAQKYRPGTNYGKTRKNPK